MESYIPLISGFVGVLIGAVGTVATVWIQTRSADRRAMYRQALEIGLEEWKTHVELAGARGGRQGILPPFIYYHTQAGVMKAYDKEGTLRPEELRKVYDQADELMDVVIEREAERRREQAEARADAQRGANGSD